MTIWQRIAAMMMVLCLLMTSVAFAEDEDSMSEDDYYAEWDEAEEIVEDVLLDDEGNELEQLTEEEREMLAQMDENMTVEIDPDELELNTNLPDHVTNILLLGIDARKNVTDMGLCDVVMVLSINKLDGSIKLTSILRDTLVTIPTKKNKYRINTSYKTGGGALSMRTVNNNFDLNCQHFVAINFYGLAAIIDSLGGVDMELTKKEASRINYELKKEPLPFDTNPKRAKVEARAGVHHLDGMQAVTYARIRGIDNDFMRTARQRKLLEVLLNQVMQDMTLDKMFTLMETALPYVLTNINPSTMMELGLTVLGSNITEKMANGEELIQQHRIPMDKTYSYKTVNGSSVVYMGSKNFPKNIEALHEFIYGEYIPAE